MKNKKYLFLLLFITIALLFIPNYVHADEATDENGISWTYELVNGNATNVKPTDLSTLPQKVTIPDKLNGYSVTSIGEEAFYGAQLIKSVTIPSSVTIIGNNAFQNCILLTEVTIPSSVTTIGKSAFSNCKALTSITIPNSVTYIGASAFFQCISLTSVDIPNSISTIENSSFANCFGLSSISLPESITTIEKWAFLGCSKLTSVNLPVAVTSLHERAFRACSSLVITLSDISQLRFVTALSQEGLSLSLNGKAIEILDGTDDEYVFYVSRKDAKTSVYTKYWFADGSEFSFEVTDGSDGITPKIQINEKTGELEVSYDEGATWTSLGKVVGENGKDGIDGKDGVDGKDGTNGKDGADGKDGESNSSTTQINGKDGTNGTDGKDGITPKIQINEKTGELEVSYDEGITWISLGTVVGEDGTDGKTEVIEKEANIKYGIKEYIICALAIFGNIGWIFALKKRK